MAVHIIRDKETLTHAGDYLVWAENGRVKFENKKTGEYKSMDPYQAAERIDAAVCQLHEKLKNKRALSMAQCDMIALDMDVPNRLLKVLKVAFEQYRDQGRHKIWIPPPGSLPEIFERPSAGLASLVE